MLLILAVVAITAVTNTNIINYANNASTGYTNAQRNEESTLSGYESYLNKYAGGNGGSTSQITWTQTSEGELAVGSTVKTSTNEEFYVFGIEGETVKLLAKNNLKVDGSMQDPTGALNGCKFSTLANLSLTAGEDLNNNATVKADETSAVYKAIKYGETLGVETGRLMLKSEAEALKSANSDILYGRNGKSSGTYLNYWLGSATSRTNAAIVLGSANLITGSVLSGLDYGLRGAPSYRNL